MDHSLTWPQYVAIMIFSNPLYCIFSHLVSLKLTMPHRAEQKSHSTRRNEQQEKSVRAYSGCVVPPCRAWSRDSIECNLGDFVRSPTWRFASSTRIPLSPTPHVCEKYVRNV